MAQTTTELLLGLIRGQKRALKLFIPPLKWQSDRSGLNISLGLDRRTVGKNRFEKTRKKRERAGQNFTLWSAGMILSTTAPTRWGRPSEGNTRGWLEQAEGPRAVGLLWPEPLLYRRTPRWSPIFALQTQTFQSPSIQYQHTNEAEMMGGGGTTFNKKSIWKESTADWQLR